MDQADNRSPKVFISYSHDRDPQGHVERVLKLADRLRADGIDANIDQYELAPSEGWPRWMTVQIKGADFVLIVCTEIYKRRLEGRAGEGVGLGTSWEGAILTEELYQAAGRNRKVIPVVLSSNQLRHIPTGLRGATHYDLSSAEGYDDLYRHLTDQPTAVKPNLGPRRSLAPKNRRSDFSLEQVRPQGSISDQVIRWSLEKVLQDQFTDDHIKGIGRIGGWSRAYAEGDYFPLLYGGTKGDPKHGAGPKDSITYTQWIVTALLKLKQARRDLIDEGLDLDGRLDQVSIYLKNRYNKKEGGFGTPHVSTAGVGPIVVDVRHCAWAIRLMLDLDLAYDSGFRDMIRRATNWVTDYVKRMNETEERGITCAAIHGLLTRPRLPLDLFEAEKEHMLVKLENGLSNGFEKCTWDLDHRQGLIDNALLVLTSIDSSRCRDARLGHKLQEAVDHLSQDVLEPVVPDRKGLPLVPGGPPDIGPSIQLLWILKKHGDGLSVDQENQRELLSFVNDPETIVSYSAHSFPWHLSAAFHLAS